MTEWMPGVTRIEDASHGSSRVDDGEMNAIAIVNHIMQGYRSTMDRWAKSPKDDRRSAHFGIRRDGDVAQYVGIKTPAWHAGRLDSTPPTWPLWTPDMNPNECTVGIEHEGFSVRPNYGYDYLYGVWPEAMVKSSIEVQQWVCDTLNLTANHETIIGHNEIAPLSRYDDPGKSWPRERVIKALNGGGVVLSPPMTYEERWYVRAIATFLGWSDMRITMLAMGGKNRRYRVSFGYDASVDVRKAHVVEPAYFQGMGYDLKRSVQAVPDDKPGHSRGYVVVINP